MARARAGPQALDNPTDAINIGARRANKAVDSTMINTAKQEQVASAGGSQEDSPLSPDSLL